MHDTTISALGDEAQRCSEEIVNMVYEVKKERDDWMATALQYKEAFRTLMASFKELSEICGDAQAGLADEQNINRRLRENLDLLQNIESKPNTRPEDPVNHPKCRFSAVLELGNFDVDSPTIPLTCANFRRVEQFASQRDFESALTELDRLLHGPLSSTTRIEGLLLKSTILRASSPELLYEALAASQEALELYEKRSADQQDVQQFLSKIQYHRGICYYQVKMLSHAKNAFSAVGQHESFYRSAVEFCRLIEEEQDVVDSNLGRSGFEEDRTNLDMLSTQFKERERNRLTKSLSLTPITLFSTSKQKRLSLPRLWCNDEQRSSNYGLQALRNVQRVDNSNSVAFVPRVFQEVPSNTAYFETFSKQSLSIKSQSEKA